jgi:hypothetical protein
VGEALEFNVLALSLGGDAVCLPVAGKSDGTRGKRGVEVSAAIQAHAGDVALQPGHAQQDHHGHGSGPPIELVQVPVKDANAQPDHNRGMGGPRSRQLNNPWTPPACQCEPGNAQGDGFPCNGLLFPSGMHDIEQHEAEEREGHVPKVHGRAAQPEGTARFVLHGAT